MPKGTLTLGGVRFEDRPFRSEAPMSQRILATAVVAALFGATAGVGATWAVWGARSDPACRDEGEAEATRQRIADLEARDRGPP